MMQQMIFIALAAGKAPRYLVREHNFAPISSIQVNTACLSFSSGTILHKQLRYLDRRSMVKNIYLDACQMKQKLGAMEELCQYIYRNVAQELPH